MYGYKYVGLLLTFLLFTPAVPTKSPTDAVKEWARTLGEELWRLSESLTKSDQIRIKYKDMNASVKRKDGKQILESSLDSVSRMLTRKINAVKCIHRTAERLAASFNYSIVTENNYNFSYCSAKYSKFYHEDGTLNYVDEETAPKFALNNSNYEDVTLEMDSHFYDINVNTNISCVHVPTNIYYKEDDPLGAVLWSEELTNTFLNNYNSDPSLAWQYFGSAHGVLRFYPGMPWNKNTVDTYDCRVRSWYIEAATCSKDVIVLFDVSGSMTGFKNYVARRTLGSLLATLSNNDYVNVFTFSAKTKEVVKCFKGLVQATPENLKTIKTALEPTDNGKKPSVPLEGNANLTTAYITAFTTLKEKRKHCDVSSPQGCNQLVMVITDYVPGNLTEVFEEYNREVVENKTYIPVRVFTYLIGKEVTNVREIQWMACLNRGYFVHIHSVEEVQQQVLKYINVIARPMILAGEEPPPTWTHANIDYTVNFEHKLVKRKMLDSFETVAPERTAEWGVSSDIEKPDEDKLVTSVAIPAFDYKHNRDHNDALLLGVAGTDVPIDNIAKLAKPHQLGVNGYSFIVSNNGYLLLHPLLITTINNKLQENYNSVDFVEVEQVDDGKGPRELGEQIKILRESLVNGLEGSMKKVKVLFHYDNMRRISRVQHDYFFNKLVGTPFSMGISLPDGYGDTELLLKDNPLEAKQGQDLLGINVTSFFNFTYRVHPDWVYCKYHYLEGHESETAEIEIFKFLANISKNELDISKAQYGQETENIPFNLETHCGTTPLGKDDYYCTEDLVKQLVFDAKLSAPYFRSWDSTEEERDLAQKYNVSVRFIATSSGLTRWHYIFDEDKNEYVDDMGVPRKAFTGKVFGDYYYNTIEETWYKAAVLQHMIDKESLVIGTKLPVLDDSIKSPPFIENENGDIVITASYAIFYRDYKSETPAAVVGFEYLHSNFHDIFSSMTGKNVGNDADVKCTEDGKYRCYVIDSSGYIVVGMDKSEVGKFFGVIDDLSGVVQSLLDKNIFDNVEVFNYQALCPPHPKQKSNAFTIDTPFNAVSYFFKWLLTEAFLVLFNVFNWNQFAYSATVTDHNFVTEDPYMQLSTTMIDDNATTCLPKNITVEPKVAMNEELYSCDHRISLYILNQQYFLNSSMGLYPVVSEEKAGDCHPAYWTTLVTKTNLLLLLVDSDHPQFKDHCIKPPDTKPTHTSNSTKSREPCHKLDLGQLPRRRLEGCFTYHDKERNITVCGIGSLTRVNLFIFISMLFTAFLASKLLS